MRKKTTGKYTTLCALSETDREKERGRRRVNVTIHAVQKIEKSTLGVAAISTETKGRQ